MYPAVTPRVAVVIRPFHKRAEQRMRLKRLGLEFRMELAAEEEGMLGDLHDFHVSSVRGCAGEFQSSAGEDGFVLAIEFIAVAVAFADLYGSVRARSVAVRLQLAGPGAQAHGAAKLVNSAQLTQLVNHTVRRGGIKFAGVGLFQPANVAGILNTGRLHSQTDAKVRNLSF